MKNTVLLTAALLALTTASASRAETQQPPSMGEHPMQGGQGMMQGGQGGDDHFVEHKAEILKHIDAHMSEVQQHKQCIEEAQNHDALRACRPPMRPGEGGGMQQGGMMPQGIPQQGGMMPHAMPQGGMPNGAPASHTGQ